MPTLRPTDGQFDRSDAVMSPSGMTPLHLHTPYKEVVGGLGWFRLWVGTEEVTDRPDNSYTVRLNVPHTVQAGPGRDSSR